jgi:hypothetical protein
MMDIYWLYDIPNWMLFMVVCGGTVAVSLFGSILIRGRAERRLGLSEESNDIIGHFLGFTSIFYGLMLGLVAVGAWESFKEVETKVTNEAATLSALYRDVSYLPEPSRSMLQTGVRNYTRFVIDHGWGLQQQGISPGGGTLLASKIADILYNVDPVTSADEIKIAEAIKQFNELEKARRLRLLSVQEGLPASLWVIILLGTVLNITLTWLLVIKNKWLDICVNLVVSVLLGSFLFFVVAMDNPFRGNLSVSAEPYEQVYRSLME